MRISLIVTTYNRPDALAAALAALAGQQGDYEVIVADDGSTAATGELVARLAVSFPVPLAHVWQPDDGFRAAMARNRAAARASGDYLVFLDGDCIALPDFLAMHRRLARRGWCVAGSRVLLSERFTGDLLAGGAAPLLGRWSAAQWRAAARQGQVNKGTATLRLPLGPLRRLAPGRWQRVRTCNLAVWREDFLRVNGLDESFVGWGYEDSEFALRLTRAGVGILDGRFAVPVIHLWHREFDRASEPANWARFQASLKSRHLRAVAGVDQYLAKAPPLTSASPDPGR